eukprot:3610749-Amphidinium_carterae.1
MKRRLDSSVGQEASSSRNKIGGNQWLTTMSSLPAGPKNLTEMMQWPQVLQESLFVGKEGKERLARLHQLAVQSELQFNTDFSGVGCFEFGVRMMFQALSLPEPALYRACDKDPVCQDILVALGAEHVFTDLMDRLPGEAIQHLRPNLEAATVPAH